ncbi:MAG: hypothetical protein QHI38_10580 [Armatimonadota bacterium]|nr:hypothetical protein [Armatimonadota bacterium]
MTARGAEIERTTVSPRAKKNIVGSIACACAALITAVCTERVAVGICVLDTGTLEYAFPVLFLALLISLWTAAAVGGVVGEWIGGQATWTTASAFVVLAVFVRFFSCLAEYAFATSSACWSSDLVTYGAFVLACSIGLLTAHGIPRAHTSIGRSIRLSGTLLLSALILLLVFYPILKGEYQWANHFSERIQGLSRELAAVRARESRSEDATDQVNRAPRTSLGRPSFPKKQCPRGKL